MLYMYARFIFVYTVPFVKYTFIGRFNDKLSVLPSHNSSYIYSKTCTDLLMFIILYDVPVYNTTL